MSPRQILVLLVCVFGLSACSTNRLDHSPITQIDGSTKDYSENPADYIDGEVYAESDLEPAILGTTEEMAIIRQANSNHDALATRAQSANENLIIEQATAADEAGSSYGYQSRLHQVLHRPDIEQHPIRKHQPYLLDSGDQVRLFVYGQPNLSRTYSVGGSGFISVPLIGSVRTRGTTTYELERSIGNLLATQYVKNPQVTVQISQYRPFFILGEVRRAGQYPFVNGMTVETAVAIAGGYSDRAYEKSIKLTRIINGYRTVVKVAPHELVYPGDTIKVRERLF